MDLNKRSKEFYCDLKEAYFPAIKTEKILLGEDLGIKVTKQMLVS